MAATQFFLCLINLREPWSKRAFLINMTKEAAHKGLVEKYGQQFGLDFGLDADAWEKFGRENGFMEAWELRWLDELRREDSIIPLPIF